ncbi:nucleoside-diphosphate sugar epimerase/dehydratase [Knoellia koreensis]|uniref:Polysaccharide biosynthesis protein n=1 Tax=Knoellia koreensis TaxID=2730921 RepID=A0A849HGR2_9MICO|nr:nucleoside-diphosphate sugar epimerase/dehydratase [Knoellia sp. DB2414S]NNM45774.1 polysaccharide biosynthesis protein [Knoellia sp. DB2414S]
MRITRWMWAAVDAAIYAVALGTADWLRYDFAFSDIAMRGLLALCLVAVVVHVASGALIGPYAVGHERGSFEETEDLAKSVGVTAVVLIVIVLATNWVTVPRSVPFTGSVLALVGMFAVRFLVRAWRTTNRRQTEANREPAIVFGAGEAGRRLTRSLLRDADSGYAPVALLDDDRTKHRLKIEGIRVRGTRSDLTKVSGKYDASTLIIALPLAHASTIRELTEAGVAAGLRVLTLPSVNEIIGGKPTLHDLRDVDLTDLLGRRPVDLDMAVIAEQIAGKRVLVTGAGGSIGSELCRQIARFGPAELFLLDRDESGLQATQMSLAGHGLLNDETVVLADIRDVERMHEVFASTRPDLVFHAAALKHLPLLEANPMEAWKSNVIGTHNVLAAAAAVGVGTFVNISTDKAANPTCVLGYSKRIAERLTADFARQEPGRYVSVRFGNVLGSRGSVVHAFTAQIERGGPITVTHPDVRRYFMLIPEACQLVLEAASIGSDGEVMVLEMGEQVKIVDVARTLIRMSGRRDIEITYTGLRPGEKLAEELFSPDEERRETAHSLVSTVQVPALDAQEIALVAHVSADATAQWMKHQARYSQNQVAGI